jgi:hypothetical protein
VVNRKEKSQMKYRMILFVLISIFVLTSNVEASNKKFKVLFVIPPTVETVLASETRSYIARELRELQDVEQVGKDPSMDHFFISIIPISLKLSNGLTGGLVISYVIEKKEIIEHNVLLGGPNELKLLCQKVIAYFDTYWLEPQRKKQR